MNTFNERKVCFLFQAAGSIGVSVYFCNSFLTTQKNKVLFACALAISILNLINICLIHVRFLLILRRVNQRIASLPESPRMSQDEIDLLPIIVHKSSTLRTISQIEANEHTSYQSGGSTDDSKGTIPCSEVCSICLLDFVDNETLVELSCSHCYHKACIGLWLVRRNTCPLCAATVTVGISGTGIVLFT